MAVVRSVQQKPRERKAEYLPGEEQEEGAGRRRMQEIAGK